jgi:L-ascorbate metabolism protein UlaG (beta-lactamase superfamily)
MHLSWFGLSAFRIETKGAVVVTDPFHPQMTKKPLRAKADIVTVSDPDNPAHNYLGGIQGEFFLIDHLGEFEVKGVFIRGIASQEKGSDASGRERAATIFAFDCEGVRLVHLGDLRAVPPNGVLERLDGVDVLFVPVGGNVTLDAEGAVRIINNIEPRLVVPMHFAQEGTTAEGKLAPLSVFLKEMGASRATPVDRLLLKKRDLSTEETRVVVFHP